MSATRISRRAFALGASALIGGGISSAARAQQSTLAGDPLLAAEDISRLEVIEHIPALYTFYDRMHPDAQAIIPRHVVIRYFREVFQPQNPQPAVATDVIFRDWTWGVNGVTYPHTAEVSFIQQFGTETVHDVVRLVEHQGEWKWFFGRDRAWVDEQIRYFSQTMNVPHEGLVPYGLERVEIADEILNRLPERLQSDAYTGVLQPPHPIEDALPDWASGQIALRYVTEQDFYPVGYAQVFTVRDGIPVADAIGQHVEWHQERPPFVLNEWNINPTNEVPFAHIEHFASDAVGHATTTYWGAASGTRVALISHVDEQALERMATALAP